MLPGMLKDRLLTSVVAIPLLTLLFFADARLGERPMLFAAFIAVLAIVAAAELVAMLRNLAPAIQRLDVVFGATAIVVVGHFGMLFAGTDESALDGPLATLMAGDLFAVLAAVGVLLAMTVADLVRYEAGVYEPAAVLPTFAAKLLAVVYVGGGLFAASQLRWMGDGYGALATLLVTVKAADIGAYFIGRIVGGWHPLKRLSPGKTLAGFVGGVVVGTAAGASLATTLAVGEPSDVGGVVLLALPWALVAVCGIVGDLVESLLKRGCGVKDSGTILPGFGGVLDLIDSPLFAGATLSAVVTAMLAASSLLR